MFSPRQLFPTCIFSDLVVVWICHNLGVSCPGIRLHFHSKMPSFDPVLSPPPAIPLGLFQAMSAIEDVVDHLYSRVAKDPALAPFFQGEWCYSQPTGTSARISVLSSSS